METCYMIKVSSQIIEQKDELFTNESWRNWIVFLKNMKVDPTSHHIPG